MNNLQKITPFLWFDHQAEEAMSFYLELFKSVFPDLESKILNVARYSEAGPGVPGTVMVADFLLAGQRFNALNGGPIYQFSPATSFVVECETQAEVDGLWDKLTKEGKPNQCGWLDDKFGVTWQIVPRILGELMSDPDPVKAERVTKAMLQMVKLDIAELKKAYEGN